MAKPEWGVKRTCTTCAARFYDLLSTTIICPACGATVDPAAQSRPRRGKATSTIKRAPIVTAAAKIVDEDEDDLIDDADVEDEKLEDDDVLALEDDEDDEGDLAKVKPVTAEIDPEVEPTVGFGPDADLTDDEPEDDDLEDDEIIATLDGEEIVDDLEEVIDEELDEEEDPKKADD